MFEHLGIVYNAKNEMTSHRSALKVIFNPFLRFIGFNIATEIDTVNGVETITGLKIVKCKKCKLKLEQYILEPGDYVIKRRRLF